MSKRTRKEGSVFSTNKDGVSTPQKTQPLKRQKKDCTTAFSILNYINISNTKQKSEAEIILDAKRKWIEYIAKTEEKKLSTEKTKSFQKKISGNAFDNFLHFVILRKDDFDKKALEIIIKEWIKNERSVLEITNDNVNPIHAAQMLGHTEALKIISDLCPKEYEHHKYLQTPAQKRVKHLLSLLLNFEEPSAKKYLPGDIKLFKNFQSLYENNPSSFAQLCENYGLKYVPLPATKLTDPLAKQEDDATSSYSDHLENEYDSPASSDCAQSPKDEDSDIISPKSSKDGELLLNIIESTDTIITKHSGDETYYLNSIWTPYLFSDGTPAPLTSLFGDDLESFE